MFVAPSAHAVSLVVMNVATNANNSVIPVGEQVVKFGIRVDRTELTDAGTDPVLLVHDLTFQGNGLTGTAGIPFNGANQFTNNVDVQTIQTNVIDRDAINNEAPAAQNDFGHNSQVALFADSWWYNSGTGVLQGENDTAGDVGNLTDPAWQLGPIKFVGTGGFTWTPAGSSGVQAGATAAGAIASPTGTNATSGQYMMYSGVYGPNGANGLTQSTLGSQLLLHGTLTVPIAQIVTTGDFFIIGSYSNAGGGSPALSGSGTFIGAGGSNGPTGNGTYNVIGGDPNLDPQVRYSFALGGLLLPTPEPSTLILAALGGPALLARRRP